MPKKGENIYNRKDGRWEGRYIRQYDATGKAQYGYIYGKTYSDVKRRLPEKSCRQRLCLPLIALHYILTYLALGFNHHE